jgi:1-aminocyclopropane-1-carboxylate deaminase/D-cysteine desulfhydrase-like pyridoxal-dependent ACC family enzyme
VTSTELRAALSSFPCVPILGAPTIVEPMDRLSAMLGDGPTLLVKRDDAIPFGFGGNKVRKLALVAGRARSDGADTLITAGGVQSNHARATAATAAKLGMRAILVANGEPPDRATANALLARLLGAEVVYVPTRDLRAPKMAELADRCRADGRRPFTIPIGASTPLGALAFALAVAELVDQMPPPDVIVHATSSGGTQAGLVAGCRLLGVPTRVVGISADAPASELQDTIGAIVDGVIDLVGRDRADARLKPSRSASRAGESQTPSRSMEIETSTAIEVDDRFVGDGYGIPTDASREAIELTARAEALFLDPTYTAKAMAGLIAGVRSRQFVAGQTVLFWHTGGQVGLFA